MNKSAAFRALLFLVIGAAIWPMFLWLKPPEVKIKSDGLAGVSISSSTLVPFVIAASFTRITDEDNKLIFKNQTDTTSTRESIFALIEENPGIHFRDVCRRLNKEIGVVQYHVYILKKFGYITSIKDGRYTRYYVRNATLDDVARNVIAAWQRPVEKTILSMLFQGDQPVLVKKIVQARSVTTQAVTWHLNRLQANGLITGYGSSIALLDPAVKEKISSLLNHGIISL